MKVEQLMTRQLDTCTPGDSLNRAAQIMWERDCGCVPVVEGGNGAARRVVGILTDRDVCMAAYSQGQPLTDIPVGKVMASTVCSCRPRDSVATVLKIMETNQVHRVPVVDEHDELVGLVAWADLAREAAREHGSKRPEVRDEQLARTVEAVSRPRGARELTPVS